MSKPGTVLMEKRLDRPSYFEMHHDGGVVCPYYGRFLKLERDRREVMTWLSNGTQGKTVIMG